MENKSIKVIDEHNIDREANKICVLDVDGSDYLVYLYLNLLVILMVLIV